MNALILITLALLGLSSAVSLANPISNDPDTFCGRKLNEAIKFFCQPHMRVLILSGGQMSKRSSNMIDQLWSPYDDYDYLPNYDFSNGYDMMYWNDFYRKRNAGKPLITAVCCKMACSLRQLIEYCPNV